MKKLIILILVLLSVSQNAFATDPLSPYQYLRENKIDSDDCALVLGVSRPAQSSCGINPGEVHDLYDSGLQIHVADQSYIIEERGKKPQICNYFNESHVWLVNMRTCEKISEVYPVPYNAAVKASVPLFVDGNRPYIMFVYAVPEKQEELNFVRVFFDSNWRVDEVEYFPVDVVKAVSVVRNMGRSYDGSSINLYYHKVVGLPILMNKHIYIKANTNDITLLIYYLSGSFSYAGPDGVYNFNERGVVIAFDPSLIFFRQYITRLSSPADNYLRLVGSEELLLQRIGPKVFNLQGAILGEVESPELENYKPFIDRYIRGERWGESVLPDYTEGPGAISPEDIDVSVFKSGVWVPAPEKRPKRLSADDIVRNGYQWPEDVQGEVNNLWAAWRKKNHLEIDQDEQKETPNKKVITPAAKMPLQATTPTRIEAPPRPAAQQEVNRFEQKSNSNTMIIALGVIITILILIIIIIKVKQKGRN